MVLPDTEWEYVQELDLLDEDLKLIADECRAEETKKMVNAIDVRYRSLDTDQR
jgi:hypothetical protein